ncbi:hypothetical protein [Ralstonia pseudosolanacearum]|uniref:hypothetical protein n=1 Tax=Ralstonia pseudosolanacearum TaxID=1310165 RepID=UPI003866144E
MTTTNNGSVFEHRYEAVENLVHEAARWALARREHQARHDLAGDLQTDEQNAAQDLEDAVHEVALYGIEAHSDDLHVDATANAMKRRLAEKRAAGYHGWNDPRDCRIENLAILLHRSLRKGNPLDVANFAMMLYRREAPPEAITAALSPWLAGQQPAAEPAPHVDLQGLHDALLAPRKILRDAEGWLTHPALPAVDEDVNCRQLLEAFGIETFMRDMETDADEATVKRYFTDGHPDCSDWTPTPPEGDGWRLLEIFDTEDGPHALFGRAAQPGASDANPVESIDAEMRRAIACPDGRAVDVLIEALDCTLRDHGFTVAPADGQVHAAEVAQVGLVGDALNAARRFIRNGVELGYIKMPDAGLPDPAHNTLPLIERAIAVLSRAPAAKADARPVAWQIHPFDYGIGSAGVYARTDRPEQVEAWKRKGWDAQPLYTHPIADTLARAIHYPDCWDTAAYPTLDNALSEVYTHFHCTNDGAHPAAKAAQRAEPAANENGKIKTQTVITLRQADALLAFFGNRDAEVAIAKHGNGLTAWCVEYPEEGSSWLGATEVDDKLADEGRDPTALPQPQEVES